MMYNEQLDKDMVEGENAEGFLEGSVEDYVNNGGLASASCNFSRFARFEQVDEETAVSVEVSGVIEGEQSTAKKLPRKVLTG